MKKENMVQTNQGDPGSENWIAVDNIRISQKYNKIYVDNLEVFFPDLEYRLLLLMIQHCNETLSVKYLFENIWGDPLCIQLHCRSEGMYVQAQLQSGQK